MSLLTKACMWNIESAESSQRTKLMRLRLEVPDKSSSRHAQKNLISSLGELCHVKNINLFDGSQNGFGSCKVLEIIAEVSENLLERTKASVFKANPQTLIEMLNPEDNKSYLKQEYADQSFQSMNPIRKLYMKVDKSHTEEVLKDYLKNFGQIDSLKLKRHEPSSKSRNFGYVLFKNPLSAVATLNQPYHMVAGYPIRLELPKPYEPDKLSATKSGSEHHRYKDPVKESLIAEPQSEIPGGSLAHVESRLLYLANMRAELSRVNTPSKEFVKGGSYFNLETEISSKILLEFDAGTESNQGWRQPRISKLISDRHLKEADKLLIFKALKNPHRYRRQHRGHDGGSSHITK
jgi:RNA recognition motif. (a.k.a. RRM, RBD, or RNP domain)